MCELRLIIILLRLSCPTQTLEHGRAVTMTTRAARGAPSSRVQGSGGGGVDSVDMGTEEWCIGDSR